MSTFAITFSLNVIWQLNFVDTFRPSMPIIETNMFSIREDVLKIIYDI